MSSSFYTGLTFLLGLVFIGVGFGLVWFPLAIIWIGLSLLGLATLLIMQD